MDKTKIRNYQIFSIIFTFVFGTILHFTYKLSGENRIVAIFSAVNESTWEHLKLLYFPMLVTTIIGYFFIGKDLSNYWCSKTIGILFSMAFTVIFFYTYTGIIGKNIDIINISSFFIAVILGEVLAYLLMINRFKCCNSISIIVLIIIFICFYSFSFNPPDLGIFKDPLLNR